MNGSDPIAELERTARYLGQLRDRRAREWMERCVGALLVGEDPRTSLGIQKADTERLRRAQRNYWLCRAYGLMPAGKRRSRCEALEKHASRFETTIWPRWRDADQPPIDVAELNLCLFRARKIGPIPAWRQLLRICVMNGTPDDTNSVGEFDCDGNIGSALENDSEE